MFQADSLGCALRAQGFQKGDRLGLWTHNCVGWVVGCVAAARAGLISVSFPPALSFRLSCLSFHTSLTSTLNISSPFKITKPSSVYFFIMIYVHLLFNLIIFVTLHAIRLIFCIIFIICYVCPYTHVFFRVLDEAYDTKENLNYYHHFYITLFYFTDECSYVILSLD